MEKVLQVMETSEDSKPVDMYYFCNGAVYSTQTPSFTWSGAASDCCECSFRCGVLSSLFVFADWP